MIIRGLERYGYYDLAGEMAARFVNLVRTYGFREYFHPETGEGYGPKLQSWATLALDLDLRPPKAQGVAAGRPANFTH